MSSASDADNAPPARRSLAACLGKHLDNSRLTLAAGAQCPKCRWRYWWDDGDGVCVFSLAADKQLRRQTANGSLGLYAAARGEVTQPERVYTTERSAGIHDGRPSAHVDRPPS